MRALMKKCVADRAPDRRDPLHLKVERMQALAADDLVLEIAADRAGLGEPRDIRRAFFGIGRIGAFEIDRERQLDGLDDPPGIGEGEVERHLLRRRAEAGGVGRPGGSRSRAPSRPPRPPPARSRRPRYCRG